MRASLLLGGLGWILPAQAQPVIAPALRDYAAGALARLIEASRERAITAGVRPLPPGIQRGLVGFFPPMLLQRVRYAIAPEKGALTLPALAFSYGDADAITLVDVVLFRDEHTAQNDLVLWAHELTHVMQYQRWGTDGFAARYVREMNVVEQEARDNAARFKTWRQGRK
jgi:Domain of unknown function (DUF4157)